MTDKIILGSFSRWRIGQQGMGMLDTTTNEYIADQPFVIVCESTFEEWVTAALARGTSRRVIEHYRRGRTLAFYYEISTD